MTANIRYMGTKRKLSPYVAELCDDLPEGPFLDLFAGVCAVSSEMSVSRNVWTNDSQTMPCYVARSLFGTEYQNHKTVECYEALLPYYELNQKKLVLDYSKQVDLEKAALQSDASSLLETLFQNHKHPGNCEKHKAMQIKLHKVPTTFPYQMVSLLYSFGYYGIQQSIELDSLRYAIDTAVAKREITSDQYTYCISALCKAASVVSNTTGHFAQYLSPKSDNFRKMKIQLGRQVLPIFENALKEHRAVRTKKWRSKNKQFQGDCRDTLEVISEMKLKPSIIYADPPYTADQYSRYYHFLDSLIRYDYPNSKGKGRYPDDRFQSDFSLTRNVKKAFQELFEGVAHCKASLILSYPQVGLLTDAENWIFSELSRNFNTVEVARTIAYKHSTMGGSKGAARNDVNELLFLATI